MVSVGVLVDVMGWTFSKLRLRKQLGMIDGELI